MCGQDDAGQTVCGRDDAGQTVAVNGPPLTGLLWFAAFAPVLLLFVLVASGKVRSQTAAAIVLAATVAIAAVVFRMSLRGELVALGKGVWLGFWILLVVWPALLLYRIASVAGLERIGQVFVSVLPRRRENLLVVSWLFPAFIQGVAGFGTPIAVSAPLLVAMGWSKTRAVLYPLVGYHWSVTFGSMGSSFYMASLTAHLGLGDQGRFALLAAALLGVNCLLGGALVLLLDGGLSGLREGGRILLVVGVPMAVALVVTAVQVPAVGTLGAATVGLLIVVGLSTARRRSSAGTDERSLPESAGGLAPADVRPDASRPVAAESPSADVPHRSPANPGDTLTDVHPVQLLSPYLYLLATALPIFVIPPSRAWVRDHVTLSFDFPATTTGWQWTAQAAPDFTPVAVFGHPGFYILLACALGYLTYRRVGLWDADGRGLLGDWLRSLPTASASIVMLAAVATVLVDAGMVSVLSRGITTATGQGYPLIAPWVGALGSFTTGSTTTSNALFAALQRDVAGLLSLPPEVLLAGQTAGGNVGNALAPVIILIGVTAIDATDSLSDIVRAALTPAAVLLVWLSLAVMALSIWL